MAVIGRSVPGQSGRIGVLRVVFTIEFTIVFVIVFAIVFASRRGEACAGRWLLRGVERGLDLRRAVAASMPASHDRHWRRARSQVGPKICRLAHAFTW